MSAQTYATQSKARRHAGKISPLLAVVVALGIASIPAQAQTVTATVATGTNPFAVAFFLWGQLKPLRNRPDGPSRFQIGGDL